MITPLNLDALNAMQNEDPADYWIKAVRNELYRATTKHGGFRSAHEGYAVVLEEVDELWDEVKKKNPDLGKLQEEAVQIAAMATRFAMDVTNNATTKGQVDNRIVPGV